MSGRKNVLLILALSPGSALACGNGSALDPALFFLIVALSLIVVPAFLVPFAGLMALRPKLCETHSAAFLGYAIAGVMLVVTGIVWDLPTGPTISLLVFAVLAIIAPSVYYFWVAYRWADKWSKAEEGPQ